MNPSALGGGAALLLVLTWLLTRRRPVTVLRSTDASAVAALNRAQISQVRASVTAAAVQVESVAEAQPPAVPLPPLPAPGDARARAALLRQLDRQLQGSTAERRAAMGIAARWGHRAVLPLLQRGLRDVDPGVVLAASRGMAGFRGRTAAAVAVSGLERLPLPPNAA